MKTKFGIELINSKSRNHWSFGLRLIKLENEVYIDIEFYRTIVAIGRFMRED